MSPRPLPEACTAAGSASPLPTFRRNGDPGMWTPLNLTWMLCTPLSRGMKRTEYMSWSMDWMKQSSSVPDGDTTWTTKKRELSWMPAAMPYNALQRTFDLRKFRFDVIFTGTTNLTVDVMSEIVFVQRIRCFNTRTTTNKLFRQRNPLISNMYCTI